uniref:Uncharacterized protein n=1 Tax=Candidatus Kentrum sp. TUN TaxID=2126343 RepID=A0A450ZSN4_9GAMM|nr:MAG: hypothetical protein BECKTUN1418F_GA0071002_10955 [Candidatus Kentron sp. TUN]VFK63637.1 MAG: hypothetical protein BECKTUN1418E_GA0071001_10929 [Candidatus Kentron sp. TUN]
MGKGALRRAHQRVKNRFPVLCRMGKGALRRAHQWVKNRPASRGPQAGARTGSQTGFQTASVMGTAQGAFAHPTPVMGTAQGAFAHPTPGRTFRDRLKGLILTARFATIGP